MISPRGRVQTEERIGPWASQHLQVDKSRRTQQTCQAFPGKSSAAQGGESNAAWRVFRFVKIQMTASTPTRSWVGLKNCIFNNMPDK
jgi:hypothetical protein